MGAKHSEWVVASMRASLLLALGCCATVEGFGAPQPLQGAGEETAFTGVTSIIA